MKHTLGIAIAVVVLSTTAIRAHHPFAAEFDWKQPVTVTGTITKFEWTNPHSMIELKGKSDKGTDATWTIELGTPEQLSNAGWKRDQFRAGDKVSIDGWLARDGSKRLSAKSVTAGGKELFAAGAFFEPSMQLATRGSETPKATTGQTPPATPQR
jgi:hypothetical protein